MFIILKFSTGGNAVIVHVFSLITAPSSALRLLAHECVNASRSKCVDTIKPILNLPTS